MIRIVTALLLIVAAASCGSTTLGARDGGGGAGGGACAAVLALDRSCTTAADCVAVNHTTNCCGQEQAIGLRASELARFQALELECDATYPACGCAAQQPYADDGSRLGFDEPAAVACVAGICTTFAAACGHPCTEGSACFTCANGPAQFAACTTVCATSAECVDPALPLCQNATSGNTPGRFCTAAGVACDTP